MPDHLVALPSTVLAAQKKHDTIQLLVTIGLFARPERFDAAQLERDLELRFIMEAEISASDIDAWLSDAGIANETLAPVIDQFAQGNREPLHLALMQGNDSGALQILAVADAGQLVDVASGRAIGAGACYALRVGYNSEDGTAYYLASFPGYSHSPAKIAWASVAATQLTDGAMILPPKAAVDLATATDALHMMEAALTTATNAHSTIVAALGLSSPQGN